MNRQTKIRDLIEQWLDPVENITYVYVDTEEFDKLSIMASNWSYAAQGIIPPKVEIAKKPKIIGIFCLPLMEELTEGFDDEKLEAFIQYWMLRITVRLIKERELEEITNLFPLPASQEGMLEDLVQAEMEALGLW